MSKTFQKSTKARLKKVEEAFNHWRKTRVKLGKTPEELWVAAVSLHPEYSINEIAKALGVNYGKLRKEIISRSQKNEESKALEKPETQVEKPKTQVEKTDKSRKNSEQKISIEQIKKQFIDYRKNQSKYSRIPEPLWQKAVKLYPKYSVSQISQALQVSYVTLKKKIQKIPEKKVPPPEPSYTSEKKAPQLPSFVQLDMPSPPQGLSSYHSEWSIEMENASGGKMKIGVKSWQILDVAAICQSFLRS